MLKVIGGSSNPVLVSDIIAYLEREFSYHMNVQAKLKSHTFSDGEWNIQIQDNVRGAHVFVVQSLCSPVNDNIMELCLILDALKRCNVREITVVAPYYGYARQDRKVEPRVPISAKAVADMLQVCGMDRLVTMDLHSGQIQGFFNVPVDNLYASKLILKHISEHNNDICIVSPDRGGTDRANYYSKRLDVPMAICYKNRVKANEISHMEVLGDVKDKTCIMIDDMVDTAGTITKAADLLKEKGAKDVIAYATHPVLSGRAIEKIEKSAISIMNVTDTIPLPSHVLKNNNFNVISSDELFAEAIDSIYNEESVSSLFIK